MLTQFVSREGLSSLITRLVAVQQDNPAVGKVPPDNGVRCQQVMSSPEISMQGQISEATEQVMVCLSCGRPGHGVSRCSRVDTLFPFLPPGWSVAFRNGQYRAVWLGGAMGRFQSGNEGWSGWKGQPPGSSTIGKLLTRRGGGGGMVGGWWGDCRGGGACHPNHREPAGMGLAWGESSRFRLVSECAGFSTIGEPPDGTFSSIEWTGYRSDVSSSSAIPGTDGPSCRGLSDCVKWGLAIIGYFSSWSSAGRERNATCRAK